MGMVAAGLSGGTAAASGGIEWEACGAAGAIECGVLKVPLDWGKPGGAATEVFVSRVPAKGRKVGTLVFNPGGPGSPGGTLFENGVADRLMPELRERYDLVSFDPRGSGKSSDLDCGPVLRSGVPVFPKNKREYDAMVASSRATGNACLEQHGQLMRNLDTRTVARDMDALRNELGEAKLNFLGLSYGSFLGTTYAQLFPQRVGRMVNDGILDHAQGSTRLMLDEAKVMEDGFNRFARWCSTDPACALHGQDVGAVWDRLVAKADKQPIRVDGHEPVDGDTIRMALPDLLPKTDLAGDAWAELADGIAQAVDGDASLFAEVSYVGGDDTAYAAVSCMEFPGELRGYADAKARLAAAKRIAPRVGAAVEGWAIAAACSGWPIPPSNPWQPTPIKDTPPILITSTSDDPSTPVTGARGLARQIRGSRLVIANTFGHTAFLNSTCARAKITTYLLEGKLPPRYSTC